jgi:trimeric autotransporter adhesin
VFSDATHFYAYDANTTGAEFYRYTVDASGAEQIDGTTLDGMGGFGGVFALDGGLVYDSGGGIINPNTTPPSHVAVLPLGSGPYASGLIGGGVVPYAAESKAFNIGVNVAGTAMTFLERFDTKHFTLEDQIQFPTSNISKVSGTRWAQDGLAYIIPASSSSLNTQPSQIFLMRGPFVLPAEAASHPAPMLISTDQGTITAGSGNLMMTLTGAGFLPGAIVLWNGSAPSQRTM